MAIIDEILVNLIDFTYHPYKALYGDLRKVYKAEAARIALARAEGKGWVQKRIDNEQVFIKLTNLGKARLTKREAIKKLMPWQREEGDSSLCVVVFDIPERNRTIRDVLRAKLREAGFVGWQKSVWVGKNIDVNSLRALLKAADLDDYVLAFETTGLGSPKLEGVLKKLR